MTDPLVNIRKGTLLAGNLPLNMADYRSSMLSGVIRLCLQTDQNASLISSLPTVISHHQLFGSQQFGSLNDIIGDVNNQLNSSKKRLQGLILLDCLIQQGSADTFSSHCQTWLNLLLQALQSPSSDQVHKLSLTVLSSLIERITSFPELARDVGTMYIAQLLPLLLTFSSGVKDEAITCIHACVIHFPGPSGNFLNKIKSMLVEELDRATPSQAAVQCYTSLAQCGSAGTQGTKHRKGWAEMCDSLVSSLIFWLGQLYEGLETGLQEEEQGSDKVFGSCQLPSTQPQQTVHIVHRFQTLCLCLESLLRESFSTWVQIPADKILKLICRALAVHVNMLSCKATTNYLLLLSYLPSIHISVLKVLSQLIVCCKRLLMPQASLIFRLVIQCLTTTNRNNMVPGVEKPFRELRESAY
ncbi:proline-, glutamic acid- and leucine-rich protein 1-like isoform X2 [Pomacea canaliculata]|uniref:proline-, glutamic acid- and leucine-rich protein 1-like isoform X2 n=1 Tax=Pomacea canaliculata TaxID=400727 RepID=UPI000D727FCC|nr:proline-, glutamic acid- and leucine-rich protein 1-like isoform X2 [Pomacea canaliculata]